MSVQFEKIVQKASLSDQHLEWFKKALIESHDDEKSFHINSIAQLTKEMGQLQEWTDKAYQDKLKGVISEAYWRKVYGEWTKTDRPP